MKSTIDLWQVIAGFYVCLLLILFHACINTGNNNTFGEMCHDIVYQTKDTNTTYTFSRSTYNIPTETYDIQYLGNINVAGTDYELLNSILSLNYGYPDEYPLVSQVIFIRHNNKPVGSYQAKQLTSIPVRISGNKLIFVTDAAKTSIPFGDELPRNFQVALTDTDSIRYGLISNTHIAR